MKRLTPVHLGFLAKGWSFLRLAVDAPDRFPGWDFVVLTASGESQARLYEAELEAARRRGAVPDRTRTLVVPDPGGRRVGSGGATLNALRAVSEAGGEGSHRILLVHSGGDSRRVPWASLTGKVFLPVPLLADPDRPAPALLDHLLALCMPLAFRLPRGGLVTLAGDVLPLFDAARLAPPAAGAMVITTLVPLDLAGKHGVIVGDAQGEAVRLLQKPSPDALAAAGALVEGGSARLDTGIWLFTGRAHEGLLSSSGPSFGRLLDDGGACSLYEEIASAFVPAEAPRLANLAWAGPLCRAVGDQRLFHHDAREMAFLHFGTTAEILEHYGRPWYGGLLRRLMAEDGPLAAPDALIVESELHHDARVGGGSLVCGCRLGEGADVGRRCVVAGLDDGGETLDLPDNFCLWQVPVRSGPDGGPGVVFPCCGADDPPDDPGDRGTFCNQHLPQWMADHGVTAGDLWPADGPRTLWHARLFPVQALPASLQMTQWMLGDGRGGGAARSLERWRRSTRVSLGMLPGLADPGRWQSRREAVHTGLLLRALHGAVTRQLDRNVRALAGQLRGEGLRARAASLADRWRPEADRGAAASRRLQIRADLLGAAGADTEANDHAARAFSAVQAEVARAVKYTEAVPVCGRPARVVSVDLPVRFDISGGWSDTPPYCLERPALVLNLAMELNGDRPVKVRAETLERPVWEMENLDLGARETVSESGGTSAFSFDDPFLLVKTALRITGFGGPGGITQGVRIRTEAAVPKGSGLGTSSILGAAVVRALQQLAGRADDTETVSDLVLVLEQQMRTGGGWQDQIGGLVPGVKCISSVPRRPLRIRVEPVPLMPEVAAELETRFVVAFTGQQRLARNILQRVVERYLRREARTLDAIRRLVELAEDGRAALAMGRLDDVGRVLGEAWDVLQQLTPECGNPYIDGLFRALEDLAVGGKLAGAGGGGFLGVMARDIEAAARIRRLLPTLDPAIRVYHWKLAR